MAERPENQRLRPEVERLVSEYGFTELDGWVLALDEKGYNLFLRNAALRQLRAAEASLSASRASVGAVRFGVVPSWFPDLLALRTRSRLALNVWTSW